jgi:hypothetical protein
MLNGLSIKDAARRIVEQLPEEATWEELIYRICVCQAIEAGLKDIAAGRTIPVEQVRSHFGFSARGGTS